MRAGADTPEELDTLLEDAFVMRDRAALAALFETRAVLSAGDGPEVAQGRLQIAHAAEVMWAREQLYLAAPQRVLQVRDTALIAGECATSVARRSSEGVWRYAIALLRAQQHTHRRTP